MKLVPSELAEVRRAGFTPERLEAFRAELAALLASVPPRRWAWLVAVVRPEGVELVPREELVKHLDGADLDTLADQLRRRRAPPPGRVLVYLEGESGPPELRESSPPPLSFVSGVRPACFAPAPPIGLEALRGRR